MKKFTSKTIAVLGLTAACTTSVPSFAQGSVYRYFFGSGDPAVDAAKGRLKKQFDAETRRIDHWKERVACRRAFKEDAMEDEPPPFSNPC